MQNRRLELTRTSRDAQAERWLTKMMTDQLKFRLVGAFMMATVLAMPAMHLTILISQKMTIQQY